MSDDILVVGRRVAVDGSAGQFVWKFTATFKNSTSGATRPVVDDTDLNNLLKRFNTDDTVTVKIDSPSGVLTTVFDDMNGRYVQKSFKSILSVLTSALDGSLAAMVSALPNGSHKTTLTAYVGELIGDMQSSAADGTTLLIRGVSEAELQAKNPGKPVASAEYLHKLANFPDYNGDGSPDNVHLIEVNRDKLGPGRDSRLDINVLHEFFHIEQGETSQQDFAKFGTTNADHNISGIFDKVSAQVLSLVKKVEMTVGNFSIDSNISTISGSIYGDTVSVGQSFRGAFIETYDGNDDITARFSDTVIDGGVGDDTYRIEGGSGATTIFDASGYDVIDFGATVALSQLLVKFDNGWVEIGVNTGNVANATTATMDKVVVLPYQNSGQNVIDAVRAGGVLLSMNDLVTRSNSAPFLTSESVYDTSSLFRGGKIGNMSAIDLDGNPISYSIVSKQGYGANNSWFVGPTGLHTTAQAPVTGGVSTITVRVSDGTKYQDTEITVQWMRRSDISIDSVAKSRAYADQYAENVGYASDESILKHAAHYNMYQVKVSDI